jgi:hypothetical protein
MPVYEDDRLIAYRLQGRRFERGGDESEEAFGDRVRASSQAEATVLFEKWQINL